MSFHTGNGGSIKGRSRSKRVDQKEGRSRKLKRRGRSRKLGEGIPAASPFRTAGTGLWIHCGCMVVCHSEDNYLKVDFIS